jgi:putative transposase
VSRSLPTIIRSFESAVSKRVNTSLGERALDLWQKGYYEHVVRSEKELVRIGEYILGNPMKWTTDRENPDSPKKDKPLSFEY